MNLDKLKEAARRHELREEWRRAAEIYQRALADLSAAGEPPDPALYNRIGDLQSKAGDPGQALVAYERAVESYADQGYFNNAIALCGKILRVDPGRALVYLRLAELNARKNVAAEVRRNLLQYISHAVRSGELDALGTALRQFADRFALSIDQRNLLAEVLGEVPLTGEARERLDALAAELGLGDRPAAASDAPAAGAGNLRGLVFIDTGFGPPPATEVEVAVEEALGTGLGSPVPPEPAVAFESQPPPAVPPLPFLEPTALDEGEVGAAGAVEGFEPTHDASGPPPVGETVLDAPVPEPLPLEGFEGTIEFVPPEGEPLAPGPAAGPPRPVLADVLFDQLDVDEGAFAPGGQPDEAGRDDGGLEAAFGRAMAESRWEEALGCLLDMLQRDPEAIPLHQTRVELAYRIGDRHHLVGAYLSLGQALERAGARENALLVYDRVLEHDPGNPVARAAREALDDRAGTPPEDPPPVSAAEYVDLGALILDPEPERDTRMRVDQGEPETEEDVDFRETLEQFKQGVAANLEADDFQAHYDLGIAFKEMGLLDEAIAQFQRALRAPGGKLKSSEALGLAFFEKGRLPIAETVLSRAVEALPGGDDEKIGLLYWLGRAVEAQGRPVEAIRWYERALAVDITFLDLGDRLHRLTAEHLP